MNILLLGNGGREHAFAWKLSKSKLCNNLFIAPGNAGTALCGTNVNLGINDFEAQKEFCRKNNINLILVGPEEPLVKGIYDYYKNDEEFSGSSAVKCLVIGPSAIGAQLEGSKAFAKKFMLRHNIPTAAYDEFNAANYETGRKYIQQHSLPIVLKADGLAAGKGVIISENHEGALAAFEEMILNKQFGEASSKVVVEQFLKGIEVSVFVITDGKDYKIIGHAKDYKRIGEADTGLNTGGMGCVSPVPFADDAFMQKVEEKIIKPTINGLYTEGIEYKGFVFFGLISEGGEPFVIEYNCRMGDPETEVVLPRLKNDLVELLLSVFNGQLPDTEIEINARCCATVMAVSGGYPGDYKKNIIISEFEGATRDSKTDTLVFHAGTRTNNSGRVVTNGGRVLAVTSFGDTITQAVDNSLKTMQEISFEGMYYRKDIGYEFI